MPATIQKPEYERSKNIIATLQPNRPLPESSPCYDEDVLPQQVHGTPCINGHKCDHEERVHRDDHVGSEGPGIERSTSKELTDSATSYIRPHQGFIQSASESTTRLRFVINGINASEEGLPPRPRRIRSDGITHISRHVLPSPIMSFETQLCVQPTRCTLQSVVGCSEGLVQSTIEKSLAIINWQEKGQYWITDMKMGASCLCS